MGQISELTTGLTSDLAKRIVAEAEPAVRRIVREERGRLAEAVLGGIPFATLAATGFAATYYLVPPAAGTAKALGYVASAGALALGAWWTLSKLTEPEVPAPPPTTPPPQIVRQTAQAIAQEAEPKVRKIVEEERERFVSAAQAGLPFAGGAAAAFLATTFLTKPDDKVLKALGYTTSAVLSAVGAWIALGRLREAP